jgi:gentisate 1,2-dioxygenase
MSSSATRLYEYSAAAAIELPIQPAVAFPSTLHSGAEPSAVVPLDLSAPLQAACPASSPNLLASFIRLQPGAPVTTAPRASSQMYYVIRGAGSTAGVSTGTITWGAGDVFTVPGTEGALTHSATSPASLYWVHDEPLMRYLGVAPVPGEQRFAPAHYTDAMLKARVEEIRHDPSAAGRNRMGVLLGHEATEEDTKTLTPILWALLNTLPAKTAQPPHRHNSVALDLCVDAPEGEGVYTMMGPELGPDGWVSPKGAVKMVWRSGAVFTTPPGWWHSHVRSHACLPGVTRLLARYSPLNPVSPNFLPPLGSFLYPTAQ